MIVCELRVKDSSIGIKSMTVLTSFIVEERNKFKSILFFGECVNEHISMNHFYFKKQFF